MSQWKIRVIGKKKPLDKYLLVQAVLALGRYLHAQEAGGLTATDAEGVKANHGKPPVKQPKASGSK